MRRRREPRAKYHRPVRSRALRSASATRSCFGACNADDIGSRGGIIGQSQFEFPAAAVSTTPFERAYANLGAGSHSYDVSGGRCSFTLTVTSPSP